MLITFAIEIILAGYAFWRYKMTTLARLAVLMIGFLAIFQLSEFMICGGLGWNGIDWMRFGYVSITVLPPLGLHMAITLAGKKLNWLKLFAYISAGAFIYFFVFVTKSLNGVDCLPNYAVFHVHQALTYLYGLYYWGWLIMSSMLALIWALNSPHKRQLRMLTLGYAVFIIPTTIANIVNPYTISGIPSIMCGFAVLMAIIIVTGVLPGAGALRLGRVA